MSFNKLTLEEKLLAKATQQGECLIWTGQKDPRGYGKLRLNGRLQSAHRLMYTLRIGPIPEGMVVRHSCDNPSCIAIDHLSLGAQLDNVHDMFQRGRANKARGERASASKLTEAQVREIRASYVPGVYGKGSYVLARRYGVSKQSIQAILSGKSWRDDVCSHGNPSTGPCVLCERETEDMEC